jgi:hypothetical protein
MLGRRLARFRQVPRLSGAGLDGRRAFGLDGEADVQARLAAEFPDVWFNKLLPHPKRAGWTLEADALVYAGDTLFALELKAYRGVLAFAEDGRTLVKVRDWLVEPVGDPLNQARFFLEQLGRVVPGARALPRVPLAVFRDDAALDLRAVHDPAKGYMWARDVRRELRKRLGLPPAPPAAWFWVRWWRAWRGTPPGPAADLAGRDRALVAALGALPTWDLVATRDGALHRGTLAGDGLTLLDGAREVRVRWADVARIEVRAGWRGGADRVTVAYRDGSVTRYLNFTEELRLAAPGGNLACWLREVDAVAPGGA